MTDGRDSALNRGFDYHERVVAKAAGLMLLEYLARRYSHSSREEWQERIRAGRVILDGAPATLETILRAGQTLVWRRPGWVEPSAPVSFAILYRDDSLLVVAKPTGLPILPGAGFLQNTLLFLVRRRFPEANPVHRLDRGTSGLVLFARNKAARSRLAAAWRRGEIRKIYRALVLGSPARNEFAIDVPIGPVPCPSLGLHRSETIGNVFAASPLGKPAHSEVRVLERRAGTGLLEITTRTGRPHQVRIHLAAAGHPLVGEPFYGEGGLPAIGSSRAPRARPPLPGDPGFLLHAEHVIFPHPESGERLEVSCHPPPALRSRRLV